MALYKLASFTLHYITLHYKLDVQSLHRNPNSKLIARWRLCRAITPASARLSCWNCYSTDKEVFFSKNSHFYSSHATLRGVYEISVRRSIYWGPTDRRPATSDRPHIWKISNGHISARGRPIHFMFGSTVGFSRSADRMALFPVEKFKLRYLRGGSSDLLRVWF